MVTYCVQVAGTNQWWSIRLVQLQESAQCKRKPRHVSVRKSMDAAAAGDHWSRCRHSLRLDLPPPLSQILFGSSHSQWLCKDPARFWIRDGGRQASKTAQGSGSDTSAGCRVGYNVIGWVCLWGSPGAGVLRLLVPSVTVGLCIDQRCVDDGVEVTRWVSSATWELFSEYEGVVSWLWMVETTELPPREDTLSWAGTETRL